MANHKSAKKRIRQTKRKTKRNSHIRSQVRGTEKKLCLSIEKKDKEKAQSLLIHFSSQLDKAAKKGIYYKRKASRKISQWARNVHEMNSP